MLCSAILQKDECMSVCGEWRVEEKFNENYYFKFSVIQIQCKTVNYMQK